MMKRIGVVLLAGVVAGCTVATDTIQGPPGLPGEAGPPGPPGDAGPQGASPWMLDPSTKATYYTAGKVGIGTAQPQSALHVVGSNGVEIEAGQLKVEDDPTTINHGIIPRHDTGSLHLYGRNGDIVFHGGVDFGTERMVVTNSGQIGIGTTSPKEELDVAGSIRTQGSGGACRVVMTSTSPGGQQYEWYNDLGAGTGALGLYNRTSDNTPITFYPNADVSIKGNLTVSGTMCCPSDARLKQAIAPLTGALARLLRLRGITYEWKEPEKHGSLHGTQIGMIAQEVEQVFPSWVRTDAEGYKTLSYRGFEALTVESLRELKADHDRLATQNASLNDKLAALEDRVTALEKRGAPQHASIGGDSRWFGGILLGAVVGLAPGWLRRRRSKEMPA